MIAMILVTPEAAAEFELLLNKPASGLSFCVAKPYEFGHSLLCRT